MENHKAIFISHAWGGFSDQILAHLVKRLTEENLAYILDKRDLSYRQSIQEFMIRLGKADMVIIILSNKYLKSEYCMFELIQIYKNDNLRERIFPIVLDEVQISSSSQRLEFVKFWENELIELQNKIKELNSLSFIEGITDDLNLYTEIRNNIARLTGILRDINTLNIQIHQDADYQHLIEAIKNRIRSEAPRVITPPSLPITRTINLEGAPGTVAQTDAHLPRSKEKAEEVRAILPSMDAPKVENLKTDKNISEKPITEKPASEKPKIEKSKAEKPKIEKPKVVKKKTEVPVTQPSAIPKIVVRQKVPLSDLDQIIESHAHPETKKPTSFTRVHLALAGVLLLLFAGIFIAWKIISKDDKLATQDPASVYADSLKQYFNTHAGNLQDSNLTSGIIDYADRSAEINNAQGAPVENYNDNPKRPIPPQSNNAGQKTPVDKKQSTEPSFEPSSTTTSSQPVFVPPIPEQKPEEKKTEEPQVNNSNSEPAEQVNVNKPIRPFTVPKLLELPVKSSLTISSDDSETTPRRVNFLLNRAIYDGSTPAVPLGSTVVGKVIRVRKSDYKRKGSIDLIFEYIIAPDGQRIPLQSLEMHLEAKGNQPYEITPNTTFKVKTNSTTSIKY